MKKNSPIILKDKYEVSASDMVEMIQTEEDKSYSLEHDVFKFTHLKVNGKLITDQNEINKIMGGPDKSKY